MQIKALQREVLEVIEIKNFEHHDVQSNLVLLGEYVLGNNF